MPRQNEVIELGTQIRGDRLIHVCQDPDVSGAVDPFEREELGKWLKDPELIAQWDVLMVAKLDRLTRSILHFQKLLNWCDEHGKTIVSVSEGFDLGTHIGRLIANILIMFAEFERGRIGERRAEAAEKIRKLGQWNGGTLPWYMMKKDGAPGYVQNPHPAAIARRIINEVIAGEPVSVIIQRLADEDEPPPRGGKVWRQSGVRRFLKSRALLGELQYEGHSVLDDDGSPVMFTDDPLITEREWVLLQDALDVRARPYGKYPGTYMMLRVAFHGFCGTPVYHQNNHHNSYYRCGICVKPKGIRADMLEGKAEEALLEDYGDDEILQRVNSGKDYSAEIRLVERESEELEQQYMAHNLSAERFASMSNRIEARLAELRQLAKKSLKVNWKPTGETVRQRWDRSDKGERHTMLRALGVQWHIYETCRISDRAGCWYLESSWVPVEEAHERLRRMPEGTSRLVDYPHYLSW
jgi:site-specific DNA recombinase